LLFEKSSQGQEWPEERKAALQKKKSIFYPFVAQHTTFVFLSLDFPQLAQTQNSDLVAFVPERLNIGEFLCRWSTIQKPIGVPLIKALITDNKCMVFIYLLNPVVKMQKHQGEKK